MEQGLVFDGLRGAQLSAVTFVQDYLQLWFDGPGINVFNPLTVTTRAGALTSWSPGFRDALCGQITRIVAGVDRRPGESLTLSFEDGSSLAISLRRQDYSGPEAYYAHGFDQGACMAE